MPSKKKKDLNELEKYYIEGWADEEYITDLSDIVESINDTDMGDDYE